MLINITDTIQSVEINKNSVLHNEKCKTEPISLLCDDTEAEYHSNNELLHKNIGKLQHCKCKHFYSFGNYNVMRLIFFLLEQTGPANIFLSTYSISPDTLRKVKTMQDAGLITEIKFLIDNRVKAMSAKAFQFLKENFEYRCTSIHAKVALIYNKDWNITIITSQNATNNPKIERGVIYTDDDVFDFDYNVLLNEFKKGRA